MLNQSNLWTTHPFRLAIVSRPCQLLSFGAYTSYLLV
nr:MAG TPA: hypothetical protein [Caudoviricetes sp.]